MLGNINLAHVVLIQLHLRVEKRKRCTQSEKLVSDRLLYGGVDEGHPHRVTLQGTHTVESFRSKSALKEKY